MLRGVAWRPAVHFGELCGADYRSPAPRAMLCLWALKAWTQTATALEMSDHSAPSTQVRFLFHLAGRDSCRNAQRGLPKNVMTSVACEKSTKSAQSSGLENIGPQRPLAGHVALQPVLSPSRITLENNGKIRPQPDRENAFARASGGGDGPDVVSELKLQNLVRIDCGARTSTWSEGVDGGERERGASQPDLHRAAALIILAVSANRAALVEHRAVTQRVGVPRASATGSPSVPVSLPPWPMSWSSLRSWPSGSGATALPGWDPSVRASSCT